MKVLKFGGTSVGSVESIKKAISIIQAQDEQSVVVFSAMAGITNMLAECLDLAIGKNKNYLRVVDRIRDRHNEIIDQLVSPGKAEIIRNTISDLTGQLSNTLEGISYVGEKTSRSSDLVLGFGETLSIELLKTILEDNIPDIVHINARDMVFTRYVSGTERLEPEVTEKAIRERVKGVKGTIITSGYIARSVKGYPSTLGRGGSDYTAALIAAAVNASILEIWSDVSGIFTANPSKTDDAHPISELSYAEALELSHFGAKIIYPPAIQPLVKLRIPIVVKNTFAPEDQGTMVVENAKANGSVVKAISSIDDICLVSLTGSGMVGVVGIAARMFGALARENISVILITQASSEQSICIAIESNVGEKASEILNNEFEYEIESARVKPALLEKGFSIIALVGEGMKYSVGICGQAFSALGRNGINIHAIAQGSSELNISVVIKHTDCNKAINALHQEFFHSVNRTINLFITGTGKVGTAFIEQILSQLSFFEREYQIEFRIVGLANSRKMMFRKEGIREPGWKSNLLNSERVSNLKQFMDEMFSLNLSNSIFIDNTANEKIAGFYESILSKSISIVTCNKIAASSTYEYYAALKKMAVRRRVHFRFESNVGAGLPIIQTISNLINTGDLISQIEAVVSGSLNFIFNSFCGGMKFSEAVLKAMSEGYTEPNPLIDLRGLDVSRKLLILVREAGMKLEASDIVFNEYLPSPLPDTFDAEKFPELLKGYDSYFENLREKINTLNHKLRVVARFEDGKAEVMLKEVDQTHPFFNLEGNDNVVSIFSKRYLVRPLVIKGAGAGADVTASGVFSDILSIVNN
jgi:bifunctional aspartokinase / homoserine dehydrogenase 1